MTSPTHAQSHKLDNILTTVKILYVRDFFENLFVNLDALEVDICVQVFVVIVQQNRCVAHRREADRRDADAAEIARVCATGEHLNSRFQSTAIEEIVRLGKVKVAVVDCCYSQFIDCRFKCMPVDVRLVELRWGDERILQVPLVLDIFSSLGAPVLEHLFELVVVDVDGKAEVRHDRKVRRNDIRQHSTLNHRYVDCRHIADGQLRIGVQLRDLSCAVIENLVEKISQLLARGVF